MSVKTVASLLHDMDLSTKKIQVFTNKTRSIYYNITIDEVILEKILLLISGFKRVQQKDFHTGRIWGSGHAELKNRIKKIELRIMTS